MILPQQNISQFWQEEDLKYPKMTHTESECAKSCLKGSFILWTKWLSSRLLWRFSPYFALDTATTKSIRFRKMNFLAGHNILYKSSTLKGFKSTLKQHFLSVESHTKVCLFSKISRVGCLVFRNTDIHFPFLYSVQTWGYSLRNGEAEECFGVAEMNRGNDQRYANNSFDQ